jgi:hypothetical protein
VPLIAALCAMIVLAGCAAKVDLAKVTYTRTTVPAGADVGENTGTTGTPKTNDEAFSSDKLRTIDACGLLDTDTLSGVGTPAKSEQSDFSRCSNYMKDDKGKDLSVSLTLGETLIEDPSKADKNIGGLPAIEQQLEDSDACFHTVVTETSPNRGIKIQIGGKTEEPCEVGRKVLEAVVNKIRQDPPALELPAGSMAELDPCAITDESVVTTALGGSPSAEPTNLHWCSWTVNTGYVWVWLRVGVDPKEAADPAKVQQVDLGGVTAYQLLEASGTCKVEWPHRPEGIFAEVVTVAFTRTTAQEGEDLCAKAQTIAKAVLPKLPKA